MADNQQEKITDSEFKLRRLHTVMEHFALETPTDVSKATGVPRPYVSEILSKVKRVPKTLGQKLEDKLGVSRRWFDLGEGDMLISKDTQSNTRFIGNIVQSDEHDGTQFVDIGEGQYIMIVPLVNELAYAGYLAGYKDREYLEDLPKHTIIVSKHHRGQYQAFEVKGESMEDPARPRESIFDGSIVTGRQVQPHLWTSKLHTHRWQDFVIVHKEGILTKRIKEHDVKHGIILLESLNPDKENYPDKEVHLNDVYQIFNIINVSMTR